MTRLPNPVSSGITLRPLVLICYALLFGVSRVRAQFCDPSWGSKAGILPGTADCVVTTTWSGDYTDFNIAGGCNFGGYAGQLAWGDTNQEWDDLFTFGQSEGSEFYVGLKCVDAWACTNFVDWRMVTPTGEVMPPSDLFQTGDPDNNEPHAFARPFDSEWRSTSNGNNRRGLCRVRNTGVVTAPTTAGDGILSATPVFENLGYGITVTTIKGSNFSSNGVPPTSVQVFIGANPCNNPVYVDEKTITCEPDPGQGSNLPVVVITDTGYESRLADGNLLVHFPLSNVWDFTGYDHGKPHMSIGQIQNTLISDSNGAQGHMTRGMDCVKEGDYCVVFTPKHENDDLCLDDNFPNPISNVNQYTIMFWFKFPMNFLPLDSSYFDMTWVRSGNMRIELRDNTASQIRVRVRIDRGGANDAEYFWTADTDWHHWAFTDDGTTLITYLDGNPVDIHPHTGSGTTDCCGQLRIGCQNPGQKTLAGSMQDFRIYDTALPIEVMFGSGDLPLVNSVFSYLPTPLPTVTGNSQLGPSGGAVTLHGSNFGASAPGSLSVEIGSSTCTSPVWLSDSMIRCTAPPMFITGGVNLPVFVSTGLPEHDRSQTELLFTFDMGRWSNLPSGVKDIANGLQLEGTIRDRSTKLSNGPASCRDEGGCLEWGGKSPVTNTNNDCVVTSQSIRTFYNNEERLTISVRWRPDTAGPTQSTIFATHEGAVTGRDITVFAANNGDGTYSLRACMDVNPYDCPVDGPQSANLPWRFGTWRTIMIVHDKVYQYIYEDNVMVGKNMIKDVDAQLISTTTNMYLHLGCENDGDYGFNGAVDDLRMEKLVRSSFPPKTIFPVFTYSVEQVTVTSATSAPGATGGTITIEGTGFGTTAPASLDVKIDGRHNCPATWVSDTVITCVAPSGDGEFLTPVVTIDPGSRNARSTVPLLDAVHVWYYPFEDKNQAIPNVYNVGTNGAVADAVIAGPAGKVLRTADNCVSGRCLHFSQGASDGGHVRLLTNPSGGGNPDGGIVSLWYKPNVLQAAGNEILASDSNGKIEFQIQWPNKLRCAIDFNGLATARAVEVTITLAAGVWRHYACYFHYGNVFVLEDGIVLDNRTPLNGGSHEFVGTVGQMRVGCNGVGTSCIRDGVIDDLRFFRAELATPYDWGVQVMTPVAPVFNYTNDFFYNINPAATTSPTTGGLVTIAGTGFPPPTSVTSLSITVGASACTSPTSVSDTEVTCIAPAGIGANKAVVLNFAVTSGSATETTPYANFDYDPPTVSAATPDAPTTGGVITVTGTNFGTTTSTLTATIAGTACASPAWLSNTLFKCTSPAGIGTNHNVAVTVGGQVSSGAGATVHDYQPPTVTSVGAAIATTGGTITLVGTNFGPSASSISVTAWTTQAGTWLSQTMVKTTVGAGASKDHAVRITVGGQQSATGVTIFSFQAPTITSLTPNNGIVAGGYTVTLAGTNFGPAGSIRSAIRIDGTICTSPSFTHTTALCILPPGSGPAHEFTVTVGGAGTPGPTHQASSTPVKFTYNNPIISSVYPAILPPDTGGTLTITGLNFGTSAAPDLTSFLGASESPVTTWVSDSMVTATVVAGVGYDYPVVVGFNPANSSELHEFSYAPPVITRINPLSGPRTGGSDVLVEGYNFGPMGGPPVQVFVGPYECINVTRFTLTELRCITTFGEASDDPYELRLWTGNQSSNALDFDYYEVSSPECSAIGELSFLRAERQKNALEYFPNIAVGRNANDTTPGTVQNNPWEIVDNDRCCSITNANKGYKCGVEFPPASGDATVIVNLTKPALVNNMISSWYLPCDNEPKPSYEIFYWSDTNQTWISLAVHATVLSSSPCFVIRGDRGPVSLCPDFFQPVVSTAFKLVFNTLLMPAGKGGWNYELETHGIFLDSPYQILGRWAAPNPAQGPVTMSCGTFNTLPDMDFHTRNVLNDTLGALDMETMSMEVKVVDTAGDEVTGLTYFNESVAVSNGAGTLSDTRVSGLTIGNYNARLYHLGLKTLDLPFTVLVGAPDRLYIATGSFLAEYASAPSVPLSSVVIETKDGCGNIVPTGGFDVTVTSTGGSLTLGGATTQNSTSGLASFTDLSIIAPAVGTYTLTFSSNPPLATDQVSFKVVAGNAHALSITDPPSIQIESGDLTPLKTIYVAVVDAGGARLGGGDVASRPTDVSVSPSLNMTGTLQITVAAGQGSFANLAVKGPAAGVYTLTVTTALLQTSFIPLTVVPGLPRTLGVSPSSLSLASVENVGLPKFSISVYDAGRNYANEPEPTVITASIEPFTNLGGTLQQVSSASTAEFSGLFLSSPKADSYRLSFRATGLGDGIVSVDIVPGPPHSLLVQDDPNLILITDASAVTSLGKLQVVAVDAGGTPVPFPSGSSGITVTPEATEENAKPVLLGSLVKTPEPQSTGSPFNDLSFSRPEVGKAAVKFSAPGLKSTVHEIVVRVGPPARIEVVTPFPTQHSNPDVLPLQPKVQVVDELGNGVKNRTIPLEVRLTPIPDSLRQATAQTDPTGVGKFKGFGWKGVRNETYDIQVVAPALTGVTSAIIKAYVLPCPANMVTVPPVNVDCQCAAGYSTVKNEAFEIVRCDPCPLNTYKTTPGDTECRVCPKNRETRLLGATAIDDCLCVEGFYDQAKRQVQFSRSATDFTAPTPQIPNATTAGLNTLELMGASSHYSYLFKPSRIATLQLSTNTTLVSVNATAGSPGTGTGSAPAAVDTSGGNENACVECPPGATCGGDTEVQTRAGFWRSSPSSVKFYECPQETTSCPGGETVDCETGYDGPLCSVCAEGYARFSGECQKCPDNQGLSWLFFWLTIIGMVFVVVFMVSTANDVSPNQVAQKVFLNYMQMIGFTGEFKLHWPPILASMFGASEGASTPSLRLLAFQCILGLDYFDLAKLYCLLPLAAILLPALVYLVIVPIRRAIKKPPENDEGFWSDYRNSTVVAITVLLTLIHPTVTKELFFGFACVDIDGKLYLATDMAVSCETSEYKAHRILFGIVLITFSVITPLVLGFLLRRYDHRLDDEKVQRTWGFLYYGYARGTRYWETVVIFRKTVVVALIVFASLDATVQAYCASWLIFFAVLMQMHYQPFERRDHFWLESGSLVATFISLQAGLLFLKEDENLTRGTARVVPDTWLIIISMAIVFLNACVLIYFLYIFARTIVVERKNAMAEKKLEEETGTFAWSHNDDDLLFNPAYDDPRFDPASDEYDPELVKQHNLAQYQLPGSSSPGGDMDESWYNWMLSPFQAVGGLFPRPAGDYQGDSDDGFELNDTFHLDTPQDLPDTDAVTPDDNEVTRQSSAIIDAVFEADSGAESDGEMDLGADQSMGGEGGPPPLAYEETNAAPLWSSDYQPDDSSGSGLFASESQYRDNEGE